MFVPSVYLTVLREDEGTDDFGDPVDTRTTVETDVPAHIYSRNVRVRSPGEGRYDQIRVLRAIVSRGHDIREGDQLDTGTKKYLVDAPIEFYNPVADAHVELELRHID